MKHSILKLVSGVFIFSISCFSRAETLELQAISDFTNLDSGAVPYYLDVAGGRNAMAINAAIESYREKFARAEHEFTGADGIYDITINALGEIDGEGTYRLVVDGVLQGEQVNTLVDTDYVVIEHLFQGITLNTSSIIGIESTAVSNDQIPEGHGFAFARGRWRSVILESVGAIPEDSLVELGVSLSTNAPVVEEGEYASIVALVVNNAETAIATNAVVEFTLSENLLFNGGDTCTVNQSTVLCELPELAPGAAINTGFSAMVTAAGVANVTAKITVDQVDSDPANNSGVLSFEATALIAIVEETVVEEATPMTTLNTTEQSDSAGSAGFPTVLGMLLLGVFRSRLKRNSSEKSSYRAMNI